MRTAFCLINHILTENQITELHEKYSISNINYPESKLSEIWSQIPITQKLDKTSIYAAVDWLEAAKAGDVVIIQGEPGSTFMLVDYALKKKLIPIHAVSKRVSKEVREGEQVQKQNIFEHICFREYEYY
jgi:hypothetical protein